MYSKLGKYVPAVSCGTIEKCYNREALSVSLSLSINLVAVTVFAVKNVESLSGCFSALLLSVMNQVICCCNLIQ